MPYNSKESNFKKEVIEKVVGTNYRWLIEVRSIDISIGGVHSKYRCWDRFKQVLTVSPCWDYMLIHFDGTRNDSNGFPFPFIYYGQDCLLFRNAPKLAVMVDAIGPFNDRRNRAKALSSNH